MSEIPEKAVAAMEAEAAAAYWQAEFAKWQERKAAEGSKRVKSILEAWGF